MTFAANADTIEERGWSLTQNASIGARGIGAGAILAHRLVTPTTTAVGALPQLLQSALGDTKVIGLNGRNGAVAAGEMFQFIRGASGLAVADDAIAVGSALKCGYQGRVAQFVDAEVSGTAILAATNGGNFANQPSNDIVQVLSSSAADTTQTVTLYGTTTGTTTVIKETIALNGTTAVDSVKLDWGQVLGIELSASCAGTVTIRKKTGPATIITILTTVLQAGVATIAAGVGVQTYYVKPTAVAGGASTKYVGYVGTDSTGAAVYDAVQLAGATAVTFATTSPKRVIKVLLGDVASASTVALSVGAAETYNKYVGQAEGQAAAQGDLIAIYCNPS